jgi:hypothetical protein
MRPALLARSIAATAATVALVALGVAGVAAPAQAVDFADHATITLTNNTDQSHGGSAADLDGSGTDTFTITTNGLTCPSASETFSGDDPVAVLWFTSGALTAYPELPSGELDDLAGTHGAHFRPLPAQGIAASVDPDTGVVAPITDQFPGNRWSRDSASFPVSESLASAMSDVNLGPVSSGDTYSLGIACSEGSASLSGPNLEVDSDRNPLIAWSTMTVNADGSFTVGGAATSTAASTSTTLAATADPSVATTADLSATVTSGGSSVAQDSGTVNFFDNSGATPLNSTPVSVDASGTATFAATGLASGDHSLFAVFAPTDSGQLSASTSPAQPFTVDSGKTPTEVVLTATATGTEIDLSAAVQKQADHTAATDAKGTVEFDETSGGTVQDAGKAVTNGVATDTVTGLTPGQSYTFTATYTADSSEDYGDSAASLPKTAQVPAAGQPGALSDGGTVVPGSAYDVEIPAATFGDGDAVTVVLHSDPQTLDPGTAGTDGSLDYAFTAPADLVAGSSHSLVFTDATDSTKTATVTFTVQAAADNTDPNDPASFATDWVVAMASTPAGMAGLFGILVVLAAVVVVGWMWFWRRRRAAQSATPEAAQS